jgi:N-methylhydantoinase A
MDMSAGANQQFFVASDIGGTFTDTVVLEASGEVRRYKSPTTPENLVDGVLATFQLAADEHGLQREQFVERITLFSHGTTVATNGLLERRGARTAVLITEGFGDTPTIMRGMKGFGLDEETLKDWRGLTKQYSIVDPLLVREIPERVDYAGRVIRPLDEEATRTAVRELVADGVEAIAVCLLWCTEHPEHERRVAAIIAEEAPDVYVSISSDVLPRIGEYSRMITTAINVFLGPEVARVTTSLDSTLRDAGLTHEPLLMQSNGGLASVGQAAIRPVSFLLSGPVGGVVGSRLVADALGERNVVTADMGGTSFDVGLVVDGRPLLQPTTVMDNQPVAVPSVAVETIGAGGGSIARVEHGALRVGPESAGAVPGPACYGGGGTLPTVTDADVVLGLINPSTFLGGRKQLDRDAAERAIREHVAEPLGLTVEEAAEGIKRIIDSRMADLIRQATIHRGHDPRNFILVAFGGAGPVHAHAFGSGLGVKQVVVPMTASVHSALGIAASELVVTHEVTHSFTTPAGSTGASEHIDAAEVNAVIADVRRDAVARLAEQGLGEDDIAVEVFVDMRFRFQIHELTIEVPARELTGQDLDELVERFIETYELRFGEDSAFTAAGVELVNWRVVATGSNARPPLADRSATGEVSAQPIRRDRVYFGAWMDATVYDEAAVQPGLTVPGPAVFELADTNIVIGANQSASVDARGNVIIEASTSRTAAGARDLEEALNG